MIYKKIILPVLSILAVCKAKGVEDDAMFQSKKKNEKKKCKVCKERGYSAVTIRDEEADHAGCHPCDLCGKLVAKRRTLRVHMEEHVHKKPDCRVPWECRCWEWFGDELRGQLVTDEMVFMLKNGEARHPEFPAFLEYSLPIIDHAKVFEIMNYYKVLAKAPSVRDMAKIYELRVVMLDHWEDTTKKGGGWTGYTKGANGGELIKEAFQ